MTKSTGKKSRERRKPYNFLDKKGTTATRQDYIETGYVNGVKNEHGDLVIRSMTDSEKEWLSQFIQETEHGNLNKTKQIKHEVGILHKLKDEYARARKASKVDEMLKLEPFLKEKRELIQSLRESCNNFYTTEEEVQEIYTRDNQRRRDVYNNAKITDNLVLYDVTEYDKFSTEAITDVNPENLILEHLKHVPVRKKFKRKE